MLGFRKAVLLERRWGVQQQMEGRGSASYGRQRVVQANGNRPGVRTGDGMALGGAGRACVCGNATGCNVPARERCTSSRLGYVKLRGMEQW